MINKLIFQLCISISLYRFSIPFAQFFILFFSFLFSLQFIYPKQYAPIQMQMQKAAIIIKPNKTYESLRVCASLISYNSLYRFGVVNVNVCVLQTKRNGSTFQYEHFVPKNEKKKDDNERCKFQTASDNQPLYTFITK